MSILVAALSVLSSCHSDGRGEGVLRLADSLMEQRPDSSLALLRRDSLLFAGASKAVRMAYVVSRTEAEDKLYVSHRSDSAMLRAAEYFSSRGSELQRVRSWYLLGRVYCDMLLYGNALSAFGKAIGGEATADSAVCRYKARACTWAGAIYEEKELHADALRYNKQAYEYARRADVPSVEVYALRDIGRSYRNLSKDVEAIRYYKFAANKAKAFNDSSLVVMVMEELAGVYIDNRQFCKAKNALSNNISSTLNVDLAPHYFIRAEYYDNIGLVDSAVYYYDKGLVYGWEKVNVHAFLKLARLYKKNDDYVNAVKYYDSCLYNIDCLRRNQSTEYGNLMSNLENKLDIERKNVAFMETKMNLIILIIIILILIIVVCVVVYKSYKKHKKAFLDQQKRVERYWQEKRDTDLQIIHKNEKRIMQLERDLSSSNATLTELRKSLIKTEAEMLLKQNEIINFERKHSELLIADLTDTEIYKLYHNPLSNPTNSDYHKLLHALNNTYKDFTLRLKDFYPDISKSEIWICCMIKIGLSAKEICNISSYSYSSLSMAKSRLYKKMFNQKGSAKDLDTFIREF